MGVGIRVGVGVGKDVGPGVVSGVGSGSGGSGGVHVKKEKQRTNIRIGKRIPFFINCTSGNFRIWYIIEYNAKANIQKEAKKKNILIKPHNLEPGIFLSGIARLTIAGLVCILFFMIDIQEYIYGFDTNISILFPVGGML
jgi:hypothetical protein